jgi:hypothetical protein
VVADASNARALASPRIKKGGKHDVEDVANKDWKLVIADEYARRSGVYATPDEISFPLIASSIFSEEIKYSPQWIPCSTGSLDVEVSEFVT